MKQTEFVDAAGVSVFAISSVISFNNIKNDK